MLAVERYGQRLTMFGCFESEGRRLLIDTCHEREGIADLKDGDLLLGDRVRGIKG